MSFEAQLIRLCAACGVRMPAANRQRRWAMVLKGHIGHYREFVARGRLKAERKARRIALQRPYVREPGYDLIEVFKPAPFSLTGLMANSRFGTHYFSGGYVSPLKDSPLVGELPTSQFFPVPARTGAQIQFMNGNQLEVSNTRVVPTIVCSDGTDPPPLEAKAFQEAFQEAVLHSIEESVRLTYDQVVERYKRDGLLP